MIFKKINFKKGIFTLLIFLISIGSAFITMRSYFDPLINNFSDYVVRCADFGQYIAEVKRYGENGINLHETVEVGKEPGLFLITTSLHYITDSSSELSYIGTDFIVRILILLGTYILVYNVTKRRIAGLIALCLTATGFLGNAALYILVSRQSLCNFFLLMLILTYSYLNKSRNAKFLVGIILGGCIMSHRVSMMFASLGFLMLIGYGLISKKYILIKQSLFILGIGSFFSAPYIFMFYDTAVDTILSYAERYIRIANGTQEYLFASSNSNIGGLSLLQGSNESIITPILEYMLYQSHIFILLLFVFKISTLKKIFPINRLLILLTTGILIYECSNLIFGTRILITFELFLIIIACTLISKSEKKKNMLIFILIIMINILSLEKQITLSRTRLTDSSIVFLKSIIRSKDSFIAGKHCVGDFGAQLGYPSAVNFPSLKVWDTTSQKNEGILSYNDLEGVSGEIANSLFTKPFLPEQLKGKDIYIIFGPYFGQSTELGLIAKKEGKYFTSPYVKLVYENKDASAFIRYIFKVNKENIIYFKEQNYLNRTLILPK